jgi:hypothetical protein
MKKYLFVLSNYSDIRQHQFTSFISPKNKKFAEIHGYEYIEITEPQEKIRGNYTWLKFFLLKKWIDNGKFKENDIILHLDADMSIQKFDNDYPCNKSFTYSIDNGNTHCMGNYSIRINEWSVNMINNLLSEERYNKLKDKKTIHDLFMIESSFWEDFREQASWYSLCGIKRHSQESFFNLNNYGWGSEKNEDTVYDIETLYQNVEILGPEWNTTLVRGETPNYPWFINETKTEDIIIRHFAGGGEWPEKYLK